MEFITLIHSQEQLTRSVWIKFYITMPDNEERDALCKMYFDLGMEYKDIVYSLAVVHRIIISERHLKRVLKDMNLTRRMFTDMGDVIEFIHTELGGSGQMPGYRLMYERCMLSGLAVRKEDVRHLLKVMDPEGVAVRKSRRLKRRAYYAQGPNFIWHFDGYDKLKPYGLCVSGCIDGYSRHIIWMNAYHTNNEPTLVAGYFLEAVVEFGGAPTRIRSDCGTENGHVCTFQRLLRADQEDRYSQNPYKYGTSTSNQRIEAYWGMLRKQCTHFWINFFKDLQENDDHDGGFLDKSITQFCFVPVLQDELDRTSAIWNRHKIRPQANVDSPYGRPQVLFRLPQLKGTRNYICNVEDDALDLCIQDASFRDNTNCDEAVHNVCTDIVERDNLPEVTDIHSAKERYLHLRAAIGGHL